LRTEKNTQPGFSQKNQPIIESPFKIFQTNGTSQFLEKKKKKGKKLNIFFKDYIFAW
jgi:hypothetical protein